MNVVRLFPIVGLLATGCSNRIGTNDLLSLNGVDVELGVTPSTFRTAANAGRQLTIRGGTAPYSVKVSNSGSATVSGSNIAYTASSLIGRETITVTDSRGRIAVSTAEIFDEGRAPNQFTDNVLWLKADALNLTNGATVATWTDSSGGGRNFTGISGPQFLTNRINGLPAIAFDGSSQYFERAFDAAISTQATNLFVLYQVNTYPGVGGSGAIYSMRDGTAGDNRGVSLFITHYNGTGVKASELYFGTGTSGTGNWKINQVGNSLALNTWLLAEVTLDSTNQLMTYSENGVLLSRLVLTGVNYVPTSVNPLRIAAGRNENTPQNYLSGQIAEVIIYSRVLSAGDQQSVRCYLKKKYALSFSCDPG